jgi:hypothetical protein
MIKDQKPSDGCNACGSTSRLQLANGEWLCADCRQEIAEEKGKVIMENAEIIWYGSQGEDHAIIILPEGTPVEVKVDLLKYAYKDKDADYAAILTPDEAFDLTTRLSIAVANVNRAAA